MNRLAAETSPYLRQHRDNPVDWYPWGAEAVAAATERNVPILLSVGYSACHWCHVMAHECFEDTEVANAMNAHFVCVKVDREERPDVDAIYMDAVQAMTGRGGWPMTVFLQPDGRPFYGGTYFPKPQFLQLMNAIGDVWRNRPEDITQNVEALGQSLDRLSTLAPADELPGFDQINSVLDHLASTFDAEWGGFGSAPKFPSTMNLDLILRSLAHRPGPDAADVVTTSLDAMASGGIYDHLGGGFARYSVDERWLVPHFEKMLYDQALLIRVYTHAAQMLAEQRFAQVVDETIGYVLSDLRHERGGFFSAEDADSLDEHGHSHEGLFYVWTRDEMRSVLGDDADAAIQWYELDGEANFEGRWIPSRMHHRGQLARPPAIEAARQRLLATRAGRRRPGLDDKVLTEWNGLMLGALAEAAGAFDRPDWTAAAVANGEFLVAELRSPDGRWHRSWQAEGKPPARHDALAADHAALVDGFTRLAELTGEARWIDEACQVADVMLDHFWDVDRGGLFTTADDGEQLIVRAKDLLDNATPAANTNAAQALYRLGALTGETRYTNHADQILRLLARLMPNAPAAFAHGLAAVDLRISGITEIVITGDRPDLLAAVRAAWRPNAVLAWGEEYDSPLWAGRSVADGTGAASNGLAYVCRDYACQLPSGDVGALLEQLAMA